jgi:hypothetical protein
MFMSDCCLILQVPPANLEEIQKHSRCLVIARLSSLRGCFLPYLRSNPLPYSKSRGNLLNIQSIDKVLT